MGSWTRSPGWRGAEVSVHRRRPPTWLRRLAWLLIRGPHALQILADLEQLALREVMQGGPRWRASLRYFRNTLASAIAVWRAELSAAQWFQTSLIDWKLAMRMLLRYPGLTVVAGTAIAFAVLAGATNLEVFMDTAFPRIPLDEGHRLVEVRVDDRAQARTVAPTFHDFVAWRDEVGSLDDLGAYQSTRRNLILEDGRSRALLGAAMTATAFRTARVPPLLGRPLNETDEIPEAAGVVVLGHEVWLTLFEGDPEVVGRTVRIGRDDATVIGVMPEGFGWPRAHDVWVPLRLDPVRLEPSSSPPVSVVARLAPGVSFREAQAELAALGERAASQAPDAEGHRRPTLMRFGEIPISIPKIQLVGAMVLGGVGTFAVVMMVAWGNVGLLLFARTAARRRELVVRTALGASRARIVGQLFAEALVLGLVATAVGLWAARRATDWYARVGSEAMQDMAGVHEPYWGFWFAGGLSWVTIGSAVLLTVIAASFAAVLPSLGTTGRDILSRLQKVHGGDMSNGWSVVIVLQVAVTVAVAPLAVAAAIGAARTAELDYGFPAAEYVTAELAMEGEFYSLEEDARRASRGAPEADYLGSVDEIERRLRREPVVRSVSRAWKIPGDVHPQWWLEVDGPAALPPSSRGHRAQINEVDASFFETLGVGLVEGRGFDAVDVDVATRANVVVVNPEFVRRVLGDRNPLGRRIAFPFRGERGPWYEIVGVVEQVGMTPPTLELPGGEAGVYMPLRRAETYPVQLVVHVGPDAEVFAGRLPALVRSVDPGLQVNRLRTLDDSTATIARVFRLTSGFIGVAGAVALLLALAGVFSVMSLVVTRRTREIGVRVALGAGRWRITRTIFGRAAKQVVWGVGAGTVLVGILLITLLNSDVQVRPDAGHALGLALYLLVMPGVCLLACAVPLRRALRVQPTEALREDG